MAMIPFFSTDNDSLHEKLAELREMMKRLKSKARDFQNEVRNEELQARKKRRSEVALWLEQVSSLEEEDQSIGTEVAQVGILGRRQLSDKLDGMMERAAQLLKQSDFPRGLLLDDFKHDGLELVTEKMEGSTPSTVQDEVWRCFESGERRVGIFGIGGVGKTSLAQQINDSILKRRDLFHCVYYVTVSRETNVLKLQSDIAKAFRHDLEYEDAPKRAAELRMAIAKREKSLLILDDVWEDIAMGELGVSAEGDGCKLLITTRKRDVCCKMNCCPIKMDPLSREESWDLFKKQLGNFETLPDEAKEIAALVAKECDGLPLGIVTMARSMRGETSVHVWRNALTSMQKHCSCPPDMENKVFRILRYSYDRLYDDKHKKCFLFCALYPEDFEIDRDELISEFIAEGLLDGTNRQERIDEGHTLLNYLENASLLECATDKDDWRRVKMHDLVRDMAIRIIGSTGMLKGGKDLKEIPGIEEWINKGLQWVSLMYNEIDHIEGMMPDCLNISVLLLQWNPIRSVSDSFFVRMIGLKVLNLSETEVKVLPGSVSDLCNLNALLLRRCRKLQYIPSLAKLIKLRVLYLEGCFEMKRLPDGMEELASLESLNTAGTKIFFTPEELLSLSHLEDLFGVIFIDVNGFSRCVGFGCFNQLNAYDVFVTDEEYLPDGEDIPNAEDFQGYGNRHLIVKGVPLWCRVLGAEECFLVPQNVHILEFRECNFGGGSLLDALPSLGDATELEGCNLWNCEGIQYIIPEWWTKSLQGIKHLHLQWLDEFGGLVREEVVHPYISFSGLIVLEIENCPKLKKLWMLNLDLPNLEVIEISRCQQMEEIFATEMGGTVKLPSLRSLELRSLPELRSIWGNCDVFFPDLVSLVVSELPTMKRIGMVSHNLPSLETIHIQYCKQMEEIFSTEKGETMKLPRLRSLEVGYLPELRSMWGTCHVFLPDLVSLVVIECPELKKIGMVSHNLPSLEKIHIQHCKQMEEIFSTEKGETMKLPGLRSLEVRYLPELRSMWGTCHVFLPDLVSLKVSACPMVKKIGLVSRNLPSLEIIHIKDCKQMEEIFAVEDEAGDDEIQLPKLNRFEFQELPELRSISRKTIVFNSVQSVLIGGTGVLKLENCPISVPRLSVINNYCPLPVSRAHDMSGGCWDSLHWNDPATQAFFHQHGCFSASSDLPYYSFHWFRHMV